METRDPLAYEIRRLGTLLLQVADDEPSEPAPAPGPLATRIADSFGLRPIDVDIALTVLAAELDDEFRRLLNHDGPRSELGILAALVPHLDDRLVLANAVGRDAPAVRQRLLRRIEGTGQLVATRRFRSAVYGRPLFAELPEYAVLIDTEPQPVPWAVVPDGLLNTLRASTTGNLCLVFGGPGVGKTTWACHAAHSIGRGAIRIDAVKAAGSGQVIGELRELVEDATMIGRAIVIDNATEMLRGETRLLLVLEEALDTTPAKVIVVLNDGEGAPDRLISRALGVVRMEPPGAEHRRALWGIDEHADPVILTLANDLVLTPRQITNAKELIAAGAEPTRAASGQLTRNHNLTLPDRSSARLDALVLPAEVYAEIVEIIGAIRARALVLRTLAGRGRAITALFDGDSGTGKTFSCEVIAAEVGLPLMRVNVSSLVDKYIGETEKNLARVFAQAQAQGGILFFDEADALFGTRTDVSRASDRYANLETNLLLQLMESFSGIVLLTTNLKKNIDQAFMRRIMFKVYFEVPERPERERLWRTVLDPRLFADGIDFRRLAEKFELSGGSIRAALLRAAYRAAAADRKINLADLVECAQLETQGMGRVSTW